MINTGYSVLMSVYAKEKPEFLRQSIESVLSQTCPPGDFVLVCDGPLGDALDSVIEEYKENGIFQIVRLPQNVGLGAALNEGLKHCKFELVARADSDDISMPERCEKQLLRMQAEQLDLLSGTLEEFENIPGDKQSKRILPETQAGIYRFARRRNPFNHPCVMFRKSAVESAGGYQPLAKQEDYYLWVRMMLNHVRCANIPETILYMRVGSGMYERRGGKDNRKSIKTLHQFMYQRGFCSLFDYLFVVFTQNLVQMLPTGIKRFIYTELLRKQ